MRALTISILSAGLVLWLGGCGGSADDEHIVGPDAPGPGGGTHTHADGTTHDDHAGNEPESHPEEPAQGHGEAPLGTAMVGDMKVEFAQGHGAVEAGKEGHLAVKLPYSDKGATIIRAWIGTEDRTQSFVGKAGYTASRDGYDIHAMVPDPLPENTMWWVEVEKPDGTKLVGRVKPIMP